MADEVLGGGNAGSQGDSNAGGTGDSTAGGRGNGGGGNAGSAAHLGGGEGKSWRDSLPEDIRGNAAISSFKDIESLTKSYISAQGMIGKKGVIVPGDKATDDDWNAFYKGIGVPDSDKYEIVAPKEFKGSLDGFKEQAIKAGLLPKQAASLLEWHTKSEAAQNASKVAAEKIESDKGIATLKNEWGDAYTKNLGAAELFLKEKGGAEAVAYLQKNNLTMSVPMIKLLSEAGKLMGEDKLREGGVISGGQSPDEIRAEIDEFMANGDKNGLTNKSHPMHDVSSKKYGEMWAKLTKGK